MPGKGRLLGPGRELQRHEERMDARHRRLSQRRRNLYRLHHAGISRYVHAVYGRTFRRAFLYRCAYRLRKDHSGTALDHQQHGKHRARVAEARARVDHRLQTQTRRVPAGSGAQSCLEGGRDIMGTITEPLTTTPSRKGNLVEMNWDPITRIVGSLGIFTKIDFENKQVAECYSTSSIFRGYSIFMKGKDPRDAHFITSRICGICG